MALGARKSSKLNKPGNEILMTGGKPRPISKNEVQAVRNTNLPQGRSNLFNAPDFAGKPVPDFINHSAAH